MVPSGVPRGGEGEAFGPSLARVSRQARAEWVPLKDENAIAEGQSADALVKNAMRFREFAPASVGCRHAPVAENPTDYIDA